MRHASLRIVTNQYRRGRAGSGAICTKRRPQREGGNWDRPWNVSSGVATRRTNRSAPESFLTGLMRSVHFCTDTKRAISLVSSILRISSISPVAAASGLFDSESLRCSMIIPFSVSAALVMGRTT